MRRKLSFVLGAAMRVVVRPNPAAGSDPLTLLKLQAQKAELIEILLLTLPVVVSYLLEMFLSVVTLIAMGRLGVEELDGASLGSMIVNVTGYALLCGLNLALDTLATQAFGAGNHHLVGLLAQRAVLIGVLFCSPAVALWWFIEPVLLALNQDPKVVHWASRFLRFNSFGFGPLVVLEVGRKFITAQGIVAPVSLIFLFSITFHSLATYLLTWPLGLGFDGCAIALSLTYIVTAVVCLLYIAFAHRFTQQNPLQCWGGFSRKAFQDWGGFLKLGLAGAALLCLEWWAFEVLSLVSGVLGTTPLAASTVAMQIFNVAYSVPVAVSTATIIRVGNRLGSGIGSDAKMSCKLAMVVSVVMPLLAAVVVISGRCVWGTIFTTEPEVLAVVGDLMLFVAAILFLNGPAATCSGALLAAGCQSYAAAINFIGYWVLAVPFGILTAFYLSWGVYGLWSGLVVGFVTMNGLFFWRIHRLDWDTLAAEAYSRAATGSTMAKASALSAVAPVLQKLVIFWSWSVYFLWTGLVTNLVAMNAMLLWFAPRQKSDLPNQQCLVWQSVSPKDQDTCFDKEVPTCMWTGAVEGRTRKRVSYSGCTII
eukprot:EG_transcript_4765